MICEISESEKWIEIKVIGIFQRRRLISQDICIFSLSQVLNEMQKSLKKFRVQKYFHLISVLIGILLKCIFIWRKPILHLDLIFFVYRFILYYDSVILIFNHLYD